MPSLTSLLARDRIVLVSKIEEALQHQVIAGGDIETVLLEMNLVPEDVLSAYRAALFNRLPATCAETMGASPEAIRSLLPEAVRRVGAIPLQLEAQSVVLAVTEPLATAARDEIAATLGREISERVVTRPRFAAALAYHYGFELDPRIRRLTDALRRRDPGVIPFVKPPGPSLRRTVAVADSDPELSDAEKAEPVDYPRPSERPNDAEPSVERGPIVRGPPTEEAKVGTVLPSQVSPQVARGTRGPLDLAKAAQLLGVASQRDDVLFILLRFAQQFFDFVAIFSLGRDGVRGRMAHGAALSPETMERIIAPLGGSGLLARAARDKRPLVGDLSADGEEAAVAAALGRSAGQPGLAVPIVLGARTVLVVYAERVGEGLSTADSDQLAALSPPLVGALRRLIVEHKALRGPSPTADDPSSQSPSHSSMPPEDVSLSQQPLACPSEAPVDDLEAIDIDRVARARERPRDTRRERAWAPPDGPAQPNQEGARGRLQGVPRSAPPPPGDDSLASPASAGRADGSYHYGSTSDAIQEENTRALCSPASALSVPQSGTERVLPTVLGVAVAQVQPRRIVVPKSSLADETADAVMPAPGPRGVPPPGDEQAPSVIIDMGSQVSELVAQLIEARANDVPWEIGELVKVGESALPALIELFPGPLWFDRHEPHKRRPRGGEVSAVARALVAFGDQAGPYLASKVGSDDADTCFYALMVAAEVPHVDLLDAVARRVIDPDDALRQLAVEVLRSFVFVPGFATVLNALIEFSGRPGKGSRRQLVAIEALGQLRDRRGLNALLGRLADDSEATTQAAHRALTVLTCQDFGLASRKWEAWAEQWGAAHRIVWLIEALMHPHEATRARAGDELKQTTQQYFGYHPQLPKRDREVTQRKYREWWEQEGRAAFGAHDLGGAAIK